MGENCQWIKNKRATCVGGRFANVPRFPPDSSLCSRQPDDRDFGVIRRATPVPAAPRGGGGSKAPSPSRNLNILRRKSKIDCWFNMECKQKGGKNGRKSPSFPHRTGADSKAMQRQHPPGSFSLICQISRAEYIGSRG